jgi:hypothetical protein
MRLVFRPYFLAIFLLLSILAMAAKDFIMPATYPAKTFPAHDDHPLEKVSIAADPYDMPDKAAIFNEKYSEKGYMPIFMVFTNDSDEPISLVNMKVELMTKRRDKIAAATEDDLYRRFSQVKRRGDEPSRNPLPIPLPGRGPKVGIDKAGRGEIGTAMFSARAIAPHETQVGFMFFDVNGISQPLAGAHMYITGLADNSGKELMYFEIPMEKYLSYTPPGTTN